MNAVPTIPDSPPEGAVEYSVARERCIGCVACLNVFSAIFRMEEAKAVAWAPATPHAAPPTRVLQCCPVGAIERVTPVSESPAEPIDLQIVSGWEAAWEPHRRDPEDLPERERRYGRLFHVEKLSGCHILSIELPRRLPAYDVLFMYGIALERPEYHCSLHRLNPRTWSVRTQLADARLRHLSGKLNSFPTGFKVDYGFPEPIGAAFLRLDRDDLHVYALPEGTPEPLVRLAAVIREHLADS
jgi:ferredoxin